MTEGRGATASSEAARRREELRRLLEMRAAPRRHPVSLQQERIWIAHQLDPDDPSHNVRTAVEIQGHIESSVLEDAVGTLLERHEQLRARFPAEDGRPVTEIVPRLDLPPEVLALPAESSSNDAETISACLVSTASRPFDLEGGPVMRWALLELGAERTIALFVVHHIACDAWSIDLLLRELVELIRAASAGRNPDLPPPQARYEDFVAAEKRLRGSRDQVAAESFWRQRLEGLAATEILSPSIVRRGTARSSRRLTVSFDPRLTEGLVALTRRRGVSLYMVLLAAFAALLHRASGATDLVIATPVTNRGDENWESVVGYFVNLLPLRLDCAPTTEFATLLGAVRREALAAHEHQALATHRIAEVGGVRQAALLEILFQHGRGSSDLPGTEKLAFSTRTVDVGSSRTGLALSTHFDGGRLAGTLEYDTQSFDDSEARRLAADLEQILRQVIQDDSVTLASLAVDSGWNRPATHEAEEEPATGAARQAASHSDGSTEHRASHSGGEGDSVQSLLADIWRRVLALEGVSPLDNFLDVGGDSLAALQIIEQVEAELGVRLTPADLFTQTLAQLATQCERRRE